MGYEVKLYVFEDRRGEPDKLPHLLIDDKRGVNVWTERDKDGTILYYHYGNDGDTKTHCSLKMHSFIHVDYCFPLAMIDLCKPGFASNIAEVNRKSNKADFAFYADDGNSLILLDSYGERLRQCDLSEAIEALEKDCEGSDYRRFKSALATLKAYEGDDYKNVKVLFYGY